MNWTHKTSITAATHGAPHHVDELVALGLLRIWADEQGKSLRIVFLSRRRTRRWGPRFDVLLDVGGMHDATVGRFDHHGPHDHDDTSAAERLFEHLFGDDPRADYLRPILRAVSRLDRAGTGDAEDAEQRRGTMAVSLSALLKAVGGFHYSRSCSLRCLSLVEPLVREWFRQAERYGQAEDVLLRAQRVGQGLFLEAEQDYGPACRERLEQQTDCGFVGFPAGKDRFQVVTLDDHRRRVKRRLPAGLPGADFIHPRGFLAVFPSRAAARRALQGASLCVTS